MTVIYICTNTKWQNINLVPALAIGTVDKFIFLSAHRGGEFQNLDNANAERPSAYFAEAYNFENARLKRNSCADTQILRGPLIGITGWRQKVFDVISKLPNKAEAVLNYLSGPSDVKIASWLALTEIARQRPDLRLRCVLYDPPGGGQSSRLEWNDWHSNTWDETIQPVDSLISLGGWLWLCGFVEREQDTGIRQSRQQRSQESAQLTRDFGNLTYASEGFWPAWTTEITGQIRQGHSSDLWEYFRSDRDLAQIAVPARNAVMGEFKRIADELCGRFNERRPKRLDRFSGAHEYLEYFRSGWLEELIYLYLSDKLAGTKAEIALDVKLGRMDGLDQPYQLDVAVIAHNQLHVIECKVHNRNANNQTHQRYIDRARSLKDDIVGPGGIMLIASATEMPKDTGTRRSATYGQIEYAAGWTEIRAALNRIIQRCL